MHSRFLYLTGSVFNDLAQAASPPTVSPAADPLYPVGNLFDDFVENPMFFGSAAADPTWTVDKNVVDNWDMTGNSGGNLTFWIEANTGTGDVTFDATGGVGGGNGMRLASGTGTAVAYEEHELEAGKRHVLIASLRSDGVNAVRVRVQNMLNLKWLTSLGAWQTAQTHAFTHSGAAYADFGPLAFDLESFSSLLWPDGAAVPVRVYIANDAAAAVTAFADNVAIWAATSWFSLHGHDIAPSLSVELRRDSAAFAGAGTLVASPVANRPTFFWAQPQGVAPFEDRYWRLKLTGTPPAAGYQGEAVLGQYLELSSAASIGIQTRRARDQVRGQPLLGRARPRQLGTDERRAMSLTFKHLSEAAFQDFWENLMRRSGYGATAVVMAHSEQDLRSALYGGLPEEFTEDQGPVNIHRGGLEVVEDPLPSVVS